MDRVLAAGDIVQLKSGGPKMTVMRAESRASNELVYCVWFDQTGRDCGTDFPRATLVYIPADGDTHA